MLICWDYCGTPGHVTRRASYPGLAGLRSLAHCLILPRALHVQQRAANGRQALAVNQPGTSSSTWHQTAGEWSSYRHGAQYVPVYLIWIGGQASSCASPPVWGCPQPPLAQWGGPPYTSSSAPRPPHDPTRALLCPPPARARHGGARRG